MFNTVSDSFSCLWLHPTNWYIGNYCVSNHRYRNRRIGDFLKGLHLTEGRNTGFKKILNALETDGSPKPEFETDENMLFRKAARIMCSTREVKTIGKCMDWIILT